MSTPIPISLLLSRIDYNIGVAFNINGMSVLWAAISQAPDKYIVAKYLPEPHEFRDPSHMGKSAIIALIGYWWDRQENHRIEEAF